MSFSSARFAAGLVPTLAIMACMAAPVWGADIAKADNTDALNLTTSWSGGVAPTTTDNGVWNSTLATAGNTSSALGASTSWLGIKVVSPAAASSITATTGATLTLLGSGIDMSAATQDFSIASLVALGAAQPWNVASGRTLTVSGAVSGSFALTKSGTGTLVLSAANTYSGATALSAGTLQYSAGGMSSSSAITASTGTTLALAADANTTFTPASLTGPASGSSYTISVNQLTGAGAGKTLTLANAGNAYVSAGTLNISSTSGDTLAFSSALSVPSSGQTTIALNGANVTLNGVNNAPNAQGTGFIVTSTGSNSLTINGNWASNTNRWSSIAVNSGILTMNNTTSGGGTNWGPATTLSGGTLNINNAGAVGGGSGGNNLTLSGGTLDNTSGASKTLSNNPAITLGGNFAYSTSAGTASNNLNLGTGAVTNSGSRTITLNGAGALTFGGTMTNTLAGANTLTVNNGTGTASTSAVNIGGYALSNSATSYADVIAGSANVNITGVISNGGTATASGLTYSGTGKLTLTGANTYAGPTAVSTSGGTVQVGNGTSGVIASTTATVASGASLLFNMANGVTNATAIANSGTIQMLAGSGVTNTLSGAITGSGAFQQNGAGTTILTGSTPTMGSLSVAAGTLRLDNGAAQTVTVSNGLTLANGTALVMDVGTATDTIAITGGTSSFTGTTAITVVPNGAFSIGTYNLISGTGLTDTASPANFTVSPTTYNGANLALQLVGGTLQLAVTSSTPANLYWKGGTSANWNTAGNWTTDAAGTSAASAVPDSALTSVNFTATGAANLSTVVDAPLTVGSLNFTATSPVTIGGSSQLTISGVSVAASSAAHTISDSGGVALASSQTWTNNDTTNTLTVSSVVSGTGASLTKAGNGTILLNAANTYSGGTVLNAGTLQANNTAALGSGALTFNGGALAAGIDLPISTTVSLTGTGAVAPASGKTVTLSGVVSGSGGGLTMNGPGTLVLSNASNAYTAGTTVSTGTVTTTSVTGLGTGTATVASGATLGFSLTAAGTIANGITNNGTTTITNSAATTVSGAITNNGTLTITNSAATTLSSLVGGTGSVTLNGTGTTTPSAANTYSGGTTFSAGTLTLGSSSTGSGSAVTDGPVGTGTLTLSGGTLQMNGKTLGNNLSAATGTTTLINFSGSGILNGSLGGSGAINVKNSGSATSGYIGTVAVDWSGFTGAFTYDTTGSNTFNFNMSSVGDTDLSHAAIIFTGTNGSSTLRLQNGYTTKFGSLSGGATSGGTNTGIQMSSGSGTLEVGNLNTDTTFAGYIGNAGGNAITFSKVGTGRLILTAGNSYTGTTTVTTGTLQIGDGTSGSLASTSAVTIASGATLAVKLASGQSFSNAVADAGTLSLISSNPMTLSSVLTGTGALVQSGTGTTTVSGDSSTTFTGTTTVTAGTLLLTGKVGSAITVSGGTATINGTAGSTVSVASGGTLTGTGTITGAVSVASGGALDLRNSAGATLTASSGLAVAGGSTLGFDLGTTSDQIALTGGLTLTGTGPVTLALASVSGFSATTYNLIANTGLTDTNDASGSFTLSPSTLNGLPLAVKIVGGTLQVVASSNAPTAAYWKGAHDASWNTVSNWTTAADGATEVTVMPDITTAITFSATGATNQAAITIDAASTAKGLTFADTTGITLGGTGSLTLENSGITVTAGTHTISTSGGVALNSAQSWTVPTSTVFTVSSPISGSATLTKAGAGDLVLSGANTYSGGTALSAGKLIMGSDTALGTSGTVTLAGATILDLNGKTLSSVALANSGNYAVFTNSNTTTAATVSSTFAASSIADFYVQGAGDINWTGVINRTSGSVTVTKSNAGTWTLASTGNNGIGSIVVNGGTFVPAATGFLQYECGTANYATINSGGTMKFSPTTTISGANSAQNWGGQFGVGVTINNGGTVDLNGTGARNTYMQWLNSTASGVLTNSNSTASVLYLRTRQTGSTLAGHVTGNLGIQIDWTYGNEATVTLSGDNTFTGDTVQNTGVLVLGHQNAVKNSTVTFNGTALQFAAGTTSAVFGGLTSTVATKTITLADLASTPAAVTIQVGNNNSSNTYSSILAGAGGFTKIGTGTQTLSNANTYTGTTTVSAGTLAVTNATGIASSAAVTVASGATLTLAADGALSSSVAISGAGTITTTGGLTLNSTRSLHPTGALNLNSAVTLTGGGITFATVGTGSVTTQALTVSNSTAITLSALPGGFSTATTQAWKLIDSTSTLTSTDLAKFSLTDNTGVTGSSGVWSLVLGTDSAVSGTGNTGTAKQIWLVFTPANVAPYVTSITAKTAFGGTTITSGSTLSVGAPFTVILGMSEAVNSSSLSGLTMTLSTGTPTTLTYDSTNSTTTSLVFSGTLAGPQTTTSTFTITGLGSSPSVLDTGSAPLANQTVAASWTGSSGSGVWSLPTWTLTDSVVPTISTVVGNPVSGSTLTAGSTLTITVTGSEALTWSGGTDPSLALSAGGTSVTAGYTSGKDSTTLVFTASVPTLAANTTLSVVGFSASPTITDMTLVNAVANQATASSWTGTPALPTWTVQDGVVPTISTVVGNPVSGSTLTAGSTLTVTVTGSEILTWSSGTNPSLALNAGGTSVTAGYTSGKDSTALVFTATVPTLAANTSLTVTGFSVTPTITDVYGNALANQATASSWTGTPALPTWTVQDGVVPTISTVVGNPVSGSTLTAGSTLTVTVTGSEILTWSSGTPSLALNAGGTSVTAGYTSGKDSTTLVFTATVPTLAVNTSLTVTGFSGTPTITDAYGNVLANQATASSWTGTPALPTWTVQDGVVPTISTVVGNPVSGSTLTAGSTLTVTVTGSEILTWSSGTPSLALNAGGTSVTASYTSGKDSTALVFTATVPTLAANTSLTVTGFSGTPTITDAYGNVLANQATASSWTGTPALPTWTVQDGVAPTITTVVGNPVSGSTLTEGSTLTVTVTGGEILTWSGGTNPSLALDVNGIQVTAAYSSGKGTTALAFTTTIPAIGSSATLTVTGFSGTPTITDAAGNVLANQATAASWAGAPTLPTWTVSAGSDTTPPTISTVAGNPASGSTLIAGTSLAITLTGSEAITWSGGTPTLVLDAGGTSVTANYTSGKGSATLVFTATVPTLSSVQTLSVVGFSATPTVVDASGNALVNQATASSWTGTSTLPTWTVSEGIPPTISSVVGNPVSGSTLTAGSTLTVTVTGSENLTWSGGTDPSLALNAGGTSVTAGYTSGKDSTTLVFTATVPTLAANTSLTVTGFSGTPTVTDASGNALANQATASSWTWTGTPALPTWTVQDGVVPTISTVVGNPVSGSTLTAGSTLTITVTGSEALTWSGGTDPSLALNAGGTSVTAGYTSGKDSTTLVFTVASVPTLAANTTLSVVGFSASPTITDMTLVNAVANQATASSWTGTPALPTWTVQDGVVPTISTVVGNPVSGSTLTAGSTLTVTVTGSEILTWSSGTNPSLALNAGGTSVTAGYTSGKDSTALVFTATVPTLAANTSLTVTGFSVTPTITDVYGNALANQATASSWTGTPALPTWTVQDGVVPTISTVVGNPVSGSTLTAGSTLTVTVTGSEILTWSSGTPSLALNAGGTSVTAGYTSGKDSTTLVFTATVPTLAVNTSLTVTGFSGTPTITDAYGNVLANQTTASSWTGTPTLPTWTVNDGVAPVIASVVGSPVSGSTIAPNGSLTVTVNFTEAGGSGVTWSGSTDPTLALSLGGTSVTGAYTSGKGTNALVFTVWSSNAPTLASSTALSVTGFSASPTLTDGAGNALANQSTASSWA